MSLIHIRNNSAPRPVTLAAVQLARDGHVEVHLDSHRKGWVISLEGVEKTFIGEDEVDGQ